MTLIPRNTTKGEIIISFRSFSLIFVSAGFTFSASFLSLIVDVGLKTVS